MYLITEINTKHDIDVSKSLIYILVLGVSVSFHPRHPLYFGGSNVYNVYNSRGVFINPLFNMIIQNKY